MRNPLLSVLGTMLLVTSCATSSRPNSAHAMESARQAQPKDPHDYVTDPTIGSSPPQAADKKPLCQLQCGPNMHCDASGITERCVPDEAR